MACRQNHRVTLPPHPDLSAPVTEPDPPVIEPNTEPDTEPAPDAEPAPDTEPEPAPVPLPEPAGEPWPVLPDEPLTTARYARRRRPVLPETAPDPDVWAALLWPWLTAAQRCGPPAAALARILCSRVDARDLTVDTERRFGCADCVYARVLSHLTEAGLLVPANPGRHRIVLPGPGDDAE
jgi:hypothetical protein